MSEQNIYTTFVESAKQAPAAIAITDEQIQISYGDLVAASRKAARALLAAGVRKGDRVSIWSVNRAEWVIAALAIQAVGGVLVPLSTRLRAGEVAVILKKARVRLVFCDRGFGSYDFVSSLLEQEISDPPKIICFDGERPGACGWDSFAEQGNDFSEQALDDQIASIGPDDLVDILFTSGTTGTPKGVPMTHRQSLIACAVQQSDISHFTRGETFCVVFPFAHNAGYRAGWQVSLLYGVRVVPVRNYDAGKMLELLHKEKPAILPAAPPIFRSMIEYPERQKFDLSSIRVGSTGGSDVPVKLVEQMRTVLGFGVVVTGYGMTETAGSVTTTHAGDRDDIVATTAGRQLSNLDMKCVDKALNEVPIGIAGEIVVRGPQVLKAYFENPEATAEAFTADGFFRTGDIGALDAEGNLKIIGRLKEMYIVGGFNCYPAEIENILLKNENIVDVAIIGVPDERLGEVGFAFIVRKAGSTSGQTEILEWCREHMANYKIPRSILFVDNLPRNPQGKVMKAELKSRALLHMNAPNA